ncbi:MAG: DEAD/DEAH box helicase family protein [Gammaproteobacteria bacterium]|nr:DEAD/DEAH box helicase family protein [Gammaproteobacteria bacterium]
MQSINFEFLRDGSPDLAALGGFAENYAHSDPQSALVKLRMFAERVVASIYRYLDFAIPPDPNLNEMLSNPSFKAAVPLPVVYKLHAVRDHGNKAAHGNSISVKTANWILKECYDLGRWYFGTYLNGDQKRCGEFIEPEMVNDDSESKSQLKRDKKAAIQKVAEQEAQLTKLMEELEAAQKSAGELQARLRERFNPSISLDCEPAILGENSASVSERSKLSSFARRMAKVGDDVANSLDFNETETRNRLIDSALVAAGWNIGVNGESTEQVGLEWEVQHQPTDTGLGYADYVLWDEDGKPLAVIEAKRTAEKPEKGQTQARLYADGLEQRYGQRPVIFYTNGYETWIWDDAQGLPPRKIFGFYSRDSLQFQMRLRSSRQALEIFSPKKEIVDRIYQHEAIKRVTESFTRKRRKTLLVQATGTGKTRVAVALVDLLIRAGWVKRVLFLCDRKELRKQAFNAFGNFLSEPMVRVTARTASDRDQRIYFATYPAMIRSYQSFDVGFFDLLIADESHRSIYNLYGDLFLYFDCLQVGLTATPVEFVLRNTFRLFECDIKNPTFNYDYERAVQEGFLVPYEVHTYQTEFLRRGIKYEQLTEEQRIELEDQGESPRFFDFEARDLDKAVYNKDTNRHIIRNLMENGVRDATGQLVGKSIIFARNHEHAVLLRKVFDDLYPQYGGRLCQVIDNYDPRAEQLIDDFKDPKNPLTIAISVDMLDTGIDIPEIVNLVFAKPVLSKVKFWQMLGRGTRLCENLFGPGNNKKFFRVFDHWGNFDYFDFHYQHKEPTVSKSLMQLLFEARLDLAEAALNAPDLSLFEATIHLLEQDLSSLPEETIAVREKWRSKRELSRHEVLRQFAPATVAALRADMAPLMQWVDIRGATDARQFDLLLTRMLLEHLKGSSRLADLRIQAMDQINGLQMHLSPVKAKAEVIARIKSAAFWSAVTRPDLEHVRIELRDIIHHQASAIGTGASTKVVDVTDSGVISGRRSSSLHSVDMALYKKQVEEILTSLFDSEPVLKKIRGLEPVTPAELSQLNSLVLTQHPGVSLDTLAEFYDVAPPLDFMIRDLVGLEPAAVAARFADFVQKHPRLTAKQTRFLSLLQNHIARYGSIELTRLYEDPFTVVDAEGLDGVFPDAEAGEIVRIIGDFAPPEL